MKKGKNLKTPKVDLKERKQLKAEKKLEAKMQKKRKSR